jgi:hypothetical protein
MRNNALSLFKALPDNTPPKFEPATVLAVGNGTVDVRMADGTIYRHISLGGGATVGGTVNVQFAGGVPQAWGFGGGAGGGGGLTVGGSGGTVTGTIVAGAGLSGGGALGAAAVTIDVGQGDGITVATNTVAVDATVVRTSRLITSGAGLSGGGDLSADRTLAVGAGTGILANADDVAVNTAYAFQWTNNHTFTKTTEQLRLAYDVSNYTTFTAGSGGNLTVAPTGDFLFDPTGNDILPVTNYDLNIGSLTKKYLTLHAAELWVETLVAQDTISTIGGRILVTPTTTLTRDLASTVGTEATITQRGSATSANGSSSSNAIALVAVSNTNASNTTSITINKPAGTLENHVMVAAINYWGDLALTVPGGWTLISSQAIVAGGGKLAIYYKVATSSEPTNYTWRVSTADYSQGIIATYSGVDTSTPIDVSATEANTSSTSQTQTAVTTTAANAMLLYFLAVDDGVAYPNNSLTATPPSGMTERADFWLTWKWMYFSDVLQASAGTTGTKTATLSVARASASAIVALKPASNTTQATVTKPTGTTTGDLLFFTVAYASSSAVLTTPTGLTEVTNTSLSTNGMVRWYYKVATASEGSNYTFGLNTTNDMSVSCVAYYNTGTVTPVEAWGVTGYGAGTSMTATSISSISTTSRLLFAGAAIASGAGSITLTPPSGMSELIDAGSGTVRVYLADVALASAGLTGDKTATLSTGKANVAGLFAIRPLVSGGSNTIYVKHNQMQAGDTVYMQANGRVEFMAITSAPTTVTAGAEYSYSVTRNLDGTGANAWVAGDALANTGTPGSGFIDLYSLESIKGIPFDYIFNYNASGGTYSANLAQESSWALWDATPGNIGANDAIYYGCESTSFGKIFHFISTPEVASSTAGSVEYWNGSAWAAVVGASFGGNASLAAAGITSIEWTPSLQTGWVANAVNGVAAYFVRFRVTAGTWTTSPVQGQRRVYRDKNTWGPTIAGMVRQSTVFNDVRERWAVGNLNGLYDYGLNTYGAAFGDPLTSWIGIDATNGIRIMNGSATLSRWDTGGNLTVGNSSASHVYIGTDGVLDINNGADVLARFGTDLYSVTGVTAAFNDIVLFKSDASFNDTSASKTTLINNTGVALQDFYRTSGGSGIQYVPLSGSFKLDFVDELGEFYLGRVYHDVNYYTSAVDAAMIIDATPEKSTLKPIGVSAVNLNTKLVLKSDTTQVTGALTVDTRIGDTLTSATLNTGWNNFGTGFQDGRYKKFGDYVFVTGLVYRASGSNTTIFTLPSGYRPALRRIFTVTSNNAWARVDVKTDGAVEYQSGGDVTVWISLDGIAFSTL